MLTLVLRLCGIVVKIMLNKATGIYKPVQAYRVYLELAIIMVINSVSDTVVPFPSRKGRGFQSSFW